MSYPFFAPAVRCKVVNWDFDAFSFLQLPQDVDQQLKVKGIRVVKVILILSCKLLLLFTQHLTHKHSTDEKQDINLFIQSMSFESYVNCNYYNYYNLKVPMEGTVISWNLDKRQCWCFNTETGVKSWEGYAWCSKRHFIQELLKERERKKNILSSSSVKLNIKH